MSKNVNQEFNVLVCGSQRFLEESFVFKTLTTFYEKMPIDNIIVSKTSGACQFALDWVNVMNIILKEKNLPEIGVKYFNFDGELEEKNVSLYNMNIPEVLIQNDPFFIKGKDSLQEHNIRAIVAIPNPEGELGVATRNIQRFCELAGLGKYFFDCSVLRKKLIEHHSKKTETDVSSLDEIKVVPTVPAQEESAPSAFGGLKTSKPR